MACDLAGDLTSALELVAMVQSVPEADRAVVNFGKRDCAFDAGLPQPVAHYRNGKSLAFDPQAIRSTGIMDQHCMLQLAANSDVQVGGHSGVWHIASVPDLRQMESVVID